MGDVVDGTAGATIAECLAAHARRDPDQAAIDDAEGVLTYGELDREVSRLASWLIHRLGPGPTMVGILTDRSRSLVTTSFAVSRAGKVSVAIDPSFPLDRQLALVTDAEIDIVLTDRPDPGDVGLPVPVVSLSDPEIDQAPELDRFEVDPSSLSAILYTSGSTGIPKGAACSHTVRIAVAASLPIDTAGPGVRCGVLDSGSSGSAEGVHCIPLVMGGCLVPFNVATRGLDTLPRWLRDQRITAFRGVPSVLRSLLLALGDERLPDLSSLAIFGEQLHWADVERLRAVMADDGVIHNTYGSTEASILTSYTIRRDLPAGRGPVPVGPPLPGRGLLIVDEEGAEVAPEESGAVIAVGGFMPSYWRRPELNAEMYGSRPDGTPTCRIGDRGWIDADGCLHLEGRSDDVVKIAGNRVDLGEVESVLAQLDGIAAAAVVARPDPQGDVRLAAFVVADGRTVEPLATRGALARRLPRWMLPDTITVLDELPQLPGGKVDRTALPTRTEPVDLPAPDDDASDDVEGALARIFADVLGLAPGDVAPDSDFFEIGGDSLRAVRVVVAIDRRFSTDLPISAMLEASTPTALGKLIRAADHDDLWSCVLPIKTDGDLPPLFMVHDGGGSVMAARRLADRLDKEQPVYAVRQEERPEHVQQATTLEAVAARYVKEIQRVEPDGPYLLFGPSFGGLLAFEMGRQLEAAGAPVGLVIMGDTSPPGYVRPRRRATPMAETVGRRRAESKDRTRWTKVGIGLRGGKNLVVGRGRRFVRHRRRQWYAYRVRTIDRTNGTAPPELRRMLNSYRNKRITAAYRGGPFHGDVFMLQANPSPEDPREGWEGLIEGKITSERWPVMHHELLHPETIDDVARAMREAIDQVVGAAIDADAGSVA